MVRAYFLADVISILADYVCYYHYALPERSNASSGRFDPPSYYGYVREVIGIVESFTEPGPFRDSLLQRFARVELLGRLQGRKFLEHPPEYREVLFTEIRAVVEEHIPPTVDLRLAAQHRTTMSLVRARRLDLLVRLAEADLRVRTWAVLTTIDWVAGDVLHVVLDTGLRDGGASGLGFERSGEGLRLRLPPEFEDVVPDEARQLPRPGSSLPSLTLRRREDSAELTVSSTGQAEITDGEGGTAVVTYAIDGRLAPDLPGAAGLAQDGTWDVIVRIGLGGVAREAKVSIAAGMRRGLGGGSPLGPGSPFRPYRTGPGNLSLRVEVHPGIVGRLHGLRRRATGSVRRLATWLRSLNRVRA